jgi:tetratricopeptide (TPR) repeat protein
LELQPDFLDGHYFLISIYQRLNKSRELTNEYLDIAKITASQGAYDQAINAYENAIQLNPNVFSLRDHLIDLLVKIGRKEEAVRELNNLAKTYQEQRKRQATFNLAKQTLPEESLIDDYMGMAGIYFKLNQVELGWNLCKDIFRIGPGDVKNYRQLSIYMGKIPNRPETARYLVKMCDYFTKKKVYDYAIQSGEKAMMFEGANPQLVENIAFSYANNDNIPRATDYYQVLINLYKMKGSTNKVLDNYRKILELSPYNIHMHQAYIEYFLEGGLEEELVDEFLALTDAFIHHQEWQNAMSMVDKVMRIDPTNDKAFEKMNLIGTMEAKAAKEMKSASPKSVPSPAAPTKSTSVPVTQFSRPTATSSTPQKPVEPSFNPDDTIGTRIMGYIRTLEINPNHYVARTKLIELYLQKNQTDDAIAQYVILADTYAALEDYSKAVEALQKLLILRPDHVPAREKLEEYQRKSSDGS